MAVLANSGIKADDNDDRNDDEVFLRSITPNYYYGWL
jgi:hypothetical protein